MSDITTAFWGMTINNYDETDLALVKQGYPDFIRQIVYTLEQGEETGTPHIQAYVKLYRQQRLSYVKKLFPRGNFKALTNDEYKLNAQRYAQKLDETAQSPATITNNPFPDPVVELVSVIEEVFTTNYTDKTYNTATDETFLYKSYQVEYKRVVKNPRMAKFYVSATYRNVKKEFWRAIAKHVWESGHTHTHTHTDEKFSHEGGITNATEDSECAEDTSQSSEGEEDGEDSENYEDGEGETDEGYSEGTGSESDAQDDWKRYRE